MSDKKECPQTARMKELQDRLEELRGMVKTVSKDIQHIIVLINRERARMMAEDELTNKQ